LNLSKNPREFPRSPHNKSGASTVGAEVFDLDLQVVQCPAQVKVEEPFSLELQASRRLGRWGRVWFVVIEQKDGVNMGAGGYMAIWLSLVDETLQISL